MVIISLPIFQMLTAPLAGTIGDCFGYDVGILIGLFAAVVLDTILLCSQTFRAVLTAHCIKGISNGLSFTLGTAKIVQIYPTSDRHHSIAMFFVMTTTAFSVLNSIMAGAVISHYGIYAWFYITIVLSVLLIITVICFQITACQRSISLTDAPEVKPTLTEETPMLHSQDNATRSNTTLYTILTDYQILIASGGIAMSQLNRVILQPTIGLWITNKFNVGPDVTGLIWGLGGVPLIMSNIIGARFAHWKSDWLWLYALVHLLLCVVPVIYLPFSSTLWYAAIAVVVYFYASSSVRFALTMLYPILAEKKFHDAYGRVMAFADIGLDVAYLLGPICAIPMINNIGFQNTCFCIGGCYALYPWLFVFLKNTGVSKTF